MTKDFMKSAGFHVKSKDLLQGIVTLCLLVFRFVRKTCNLMMKLNLKNMHVLTGNLFYHRGLEIVEKTMSDLVTKVHKLLLFQQG